MSQRTVLVTTEGHRYRLIERVQNDLRSLGIEIGLGTLEQILDSYDSRVEAERDRD